MNVKDFVKIMINDICDGIDEARTEQAGKRSGQVAVAPGSINGKAMMVDDVLKIIHFDLSIEVEDSTKKSGNANLKVMSGGIDSDKSKKSINKVSFDVPYIPAALTQFSKLERK